MLNEANQANVLNSVERIRPQSRDRAAATRVAASRNPVSESTPWVGKSFAMYVCESKGAVVKEV